MLLHRFSSFHVDPRSLIEPRAEATANWWYMFNSNMETAKCLPMNLACKVLQRPTNILFQSIVPRSSRRPDRMPERPKPTVLAHWFLKLLLYKIAIFFQDGATGLVLH